MTRAVALAVVFAAAALHAHRGGTAMPSHHPSAALTRHTAHLERLRRGGQMVRTDAYAVVKYHMLDAQLAEVAKTAAGFDVSNAAGSRLLVDTTTPEGDFKRVTLSAGPELGEEPLVVNLSGDAVDSALILDRWRGSEVSCTVTTSSDGSFTVEFVNSTGESLAFG